MVEDAFRDRCFIMDFVVRNHSSTMQAVLNHPPIGARGQDLKSSKGKLYEKIPVPSFLADPSHCVKVVAKHIFFILNDSKSHQCGCTKADAL